jgi:hypothetical protein
VGELIQLVSHTAQCRSRVGRTGLPNPMSGFLPPRFGFAFGVAVSRAKKWLEISLPAA